MAAVSNAQRPVSAIMGEYPPGATPVSSDPKARNACMRGRELELVPISRLIGGEGWQDMLQGMRRIMIAVGARWGFI